MARYENRETFDGSRVWFIVDTATGDETHSSAWEGIGGGGAGFWAEKLNEVYSAGWKDGTAATRAADIVHVQDHGPWIATDDLRDLPLPEAP